MPPKETQPTMLTDVHYSDEESAEFERWISLINSESSSNQDAQDKLLQDLNRHLSTRTTILGNKSSPADVVLYEWLKPKVTGWTPKQRTGEGGYHHIVRYLDFLQNSPIFGLNVQEQDKIDIDVDNILSPPKVTDPAEEKERRKKEKATAAVASAPKTPDESGSTTGDSKTVTKAGPVDNGNGTGSAPLAHRPKKEKQPKSAKQAPSKDSAAPAGPRPSLIDLRVGHILQAVNHPNADSLYVSTIACGDPPGTDNTSSFEGQVVRTVCSGLNGLVPLEAMQGRKVVVVCNLKPVTMRGVKSAAMVLAASPRPAEGEEDSHKGPVELVKPPPDSKPGERVYFEGWEGDPEGILNPKKKVWESVQPGFTTTDDLRVAFDIAAALQVIDPDASGGRKEGVAHLRTQSGGYCTVESLKGAVVR
jgi:aminoacyl tRNA synthase complex-interacting multifunctional protein 1